MRSDRYQPVVRAAVAVFAFTCLGAVGAEAQTRMVDAARDGDITAVRALLRQRADVNIAETDGTTALHWAARAGDAALTDLLLKAGAQPNATNRYGVTPLALAAGNGEPRTVERLLAAGAKVDATSAQGQTAILLAARSGNAETIRILAARGADVNVAETWMGEPPLIWAAAENNAAAIIEPKRPRDAYRSAIDPRLIKFIIA